MQTNARSLFDIYLFRYLIYFSCFREGQEKIKDFSHAFGDFGFNFLPLHIGVLYQYVLKP